MRSTYWDSVKGIAIIAVIIIHSLTTSIKFPIDSFNFLFGVSFRQLVNFAVPVFFALAGLFAIPKNGQSNSSFIINRVKALLPAYLTWTIIYILIFKIDHFKSLELIFDDFILGMGIGIGYFVIVLIQFIIITPIILKIKTVKLHIFTMSLLFLLGIIYRYLTGIFYPDNIISQYPYSALLFFIWYPFYHLGIFASLYKKEITYFIRKNIIIICVMLLLMFILTIFEGNILALNNLVSFGVSQVKISSFLTSILFFLLLLYFSYFKQYNSLSYLAWLGKNSYIIYLSHVAILDVYTFFLKKINYIYDNQIIFVLILTSLVLSSAVLMIIILSKFFNLKLQFLLGLK